MHEHLPPIPVNDRDRALFALPPRQDSEKGVT